MSGALSFTPIQVPDFGATLARAQGMQANRLAMLAQQRQMEQDDALQAAIAQAAPQLGSDNAQTRLNALTALAQAGPRGLQFALPMMQEARDDLQFYGPGGAPASPGAPAAAPAPGGSRGLAPIASTDLPPEAVRFLDAVAAPESGGRYNVRWGGPQGPQQFSDMSRHPGIMAPGPEGPSSAAGRYQFVRSTWEPLAQRYGARDFSPQTQDRVAWSWAQDEYRQVTGRDLRADINDPARRGDIQRVMSRPSMWTTFNAGRMGAPDSEARTIPVADGGAPAATPTSGGIPGLPAVPGVNMGEVERAVQLPPSNRRAQQILQRYFQFAQLNQRDTAVEVVADPNSPTGRRFVLRSQAAGMPAPSSDRNEQFVDLGEDAPQGAGRYRVGAGGSLQRVASLPGDPNSAPFNRENTLRDEFNTLSAPFRTVQTAWENIQSAARSQNGAGDMSLLYAYVKLLDPTSVVRESEFATAAASGSFGERVQGAVQRLLSGERMADSLRNDFVTQARDLYNNSRRPYDRLEQHYRGIAQRHNLNPENIIGPYATPDAEADRTPPPAPPPPAPPQPGQPDPRRAQVEALVQDARRQLGQSASQADIEAYVRRRLNGGR